MEITILGATGLVGRELLALIERAWPGAALQLYASRDQTLELDDRTFSVRAAERLLGPDAPRGDLAFVALDDAHSERYCPRLRALGYRVIDKSNTYRRDPAVPLVVAGVNHELVTERVDLVANPNCTTIPLALALAPLHRRFRLSAVAVSTYQAISGAGLATLDDFLTGSRAGYTVETRLGEGFDPTGYPANTVPHRGKTDNSGFSAEERKLVFESRKILELSGDLVSAQCCRVPVAVGHYENAWVTFEEPAPLEEVAAILADARRAPFVRYFPGAEGDGLTALACVRERDLALVGRLRRDARDASDRAICLAVAADNLRLGAATNAVRIASRWFPGADAELCA